MRLPIHQIDAFADKVFKGNPAAVVPLKEWLPDAVMQSIAAENNLAETAFFVPEQRDGVKGYGLRWFTPAVEVDLCGHATLASAWVIFNKLDGARRQIDFFTKGGRLTVTQDGESGRLAMDFPARAPEPVTACAGLIQAIGAPPKDVLAARDYFLVYDEAEIVRSLTPDMVGLAHADKFAVIVTAPGDRPGLDCVSRFFAPKMGIPEDPVTGSAHCTAVPYWAKRLGKRDIVAYQASPRGGTLYCRDEGARVRIAGVCQPYLEGSITV
ncbi:MAG TPA: PhzF family phenazine biosynthesis protein [Ferrovibrio sp.]|uniref:PhzF family phenazine biosynthesis protein n=1 Tax=Ferrovibrio sp. TaxID=1917215 RepID=UPI002ED5A2B3